MVRNEGFLLESRFKVQGGFVVQDEILNLEQPSKIKGFRVSGSRFKKKVKIIYILDLIVKIYKYTYILYIK